MMLRRLLPRVGLAVMAILVAFLLCEIAARMIFPRPPSGTREPQLALLFDPEIRYVLAPNQQGWIDDGLVTVNALGFRGPAVVVPKPPGRFRVAIAGDSLTMGWGVADDETYAARLEPLLRSGSPSRDADVVNLGVGGYNTRQEVTLLERHVATLQPDLVLIGFYSNDVPDALDDTEASAPGGTRILAENPRAGYVLRINPTPTDWWNRQLRRSRVIHLAGRAMNQLRGRGEWGMSRYAMEMDMLRDGTSPELEQAWARVAVEFDRLEALAREEGFTVGLVVLPCKEQVTGEFQSGKYLETIRSLAGARGFHVIDPVPLMRQQAAGRRDLYIPYDRNHPSPEGHALIAQAVHRYLADHGLVTALGDKEATEEAEIGTTKSAPRAARRKERESETHRQ
jgi:lysophospholipase L1-like esterase